MPREAAVELFFQGTGRGVSLLVAKGILKINPGSRPQ
jgi:hypothetical protein